MRTDLSIDRARGALRELAAARLPALTFDLRELRLTETGALRFPTGVAILSYHARRQLAGWLDTRVESVPSDGDIHVTALANARLASATDRVCLHLVRAGDGMVVRAVVETHRSVVGEELLDAVLAFLDDATAYGIEQGANHTVLVARTGRRFDAGGHAHEHGVAVSLDERGTVLVFAAVFLPGASVPALHLLKAQRTDASPLGIASAFREALEREGLRELEVRSALAELAPRPSLMAEIYLDHPDIPAEYTRRVQTRLAEREALTRYDVALEMLAHVETLDAEARFAVAWRAGNLLFIDE